VAAYFGNQNKSSTMSQSMSAQHSKTNIKRTQQSTSHYPAPRSLGLAKSKTMPHISLAHLQLLDEDNVDDAFEELFKS
jgi:hypothetical protein